MKMDGGVEQERDRLRKEVHEGTKEERSREYLEIPKLFSEVNAGYQVIRLYYHAFAEFYN